MRGVAILATVTFLAAQDQAQDSIRKNYSAAVDDLSAGRIVDARKNLEQILKEHPDYFRGYKVYWDVVGRSQDEVARRAAAERDCKLFEAAPTEKRTEDFYSNMIAGYEILGNMKRIVE